MAEKKEAGQIAFEALCGKGSWHLAEEALDACAPWARIESAVRADELARLKGALLPLRLLLTVANFRESVAMLDKALALPQPAAPILDTAPGLAADDEGLRREMGGKQ